MLWVFDLEMGRAQVQELKHWSVQALYLYKGCRRMKTLIMLNLAKSTYDFHWF
jgi:hypothetical protein